MSRYAVTGQGGNGLPSRPYFPGGRVVRALVAPELRDRMPVPAREDPAPVPEPEPEPVAVPEAGPAPETALAPAARCGQCGYLTTAVGHQVTCGTGS